MNNWYYLGRHAFIISELVTMKTMVDRVLAIVDDEAASAESRFRTQSEGVPDEALDVARDELWISQNIIPRYIMNSLFTSLFALFEDEMVSVCELVGEKTEGPKAFINFTNGIGISKVKNYLKEKANVNVEEYSSWQKISNIKDLRNMILHNNGRFEGRDQRAAERLAKYIESSEWLSIGEFRQIEIDRQYLNHVENVFRMFLKDLFPGLETRQLLL